MKAIIANCLLALFLLLAPFSGLAQDLPVPIETLRNDVQTLQAAAARLEEENLGLRQALKGLEDDELYLVVDTEINRLSLRQGSDVLHTAVLRNRQSQFHESGNGRQLVF